MKLSTLQLEQTPTKVVDLQLANTEEVVKVGLKWLPIRAREQCIRRAQAAAAANGAAKWDEENPLCTLAFWVEVVAAAAFDPDSPTQEPWATAEELRNHPFIGQENILYLYEQYEAFEESHSIRAKTLTRTELLYTCYRLAEGDESPLERMRLGTLRACLRFMASMLWTLLKDKSPSTLAGLLEPEPSTPDPTEKPKTSETQGSGS